MTEFLENPRVCPLCDGEIREPSVNSDFVAFVRCERCKQFKITKPGYDDLSQHKEERYRLSALFRNRLENDWPTIGYPSVRVLLRQAPRLTVSEQLDRLLDILASMTQELGAYSDFSPSRDYPLLVARGPNEADYLLTALAQMRYVWPDLSNKRNTVTASGWKRLEEMRQAGKDSRFGFVAMSFDSSMTALYDGAIEPAIRKAGYEPIRVDRRESLNKIDDEIIGQMRRARFMVADFTGQRQGVYFEAGFMRGLGRNVIWMCSKEEVDAGKVHFDVRQYPFIAWESHDEARDRLYRRILANEGEGASAAQA